MSLNSSFIQRNLQYVSRSDRSKVVGVHLFWGQKVKVKVTNHKTLLVLVFFSCCSFSLYRDRRINDIPLEEHHKNAPEGVVFVTWLLQW